MICQITQLPNLNYQTSAYEPKIKEYEDFNKLYMEQKNIGNMEFIYAK